MPTGIFASEETVGAMQEILLASTAAGREVTGVARLRPATEEERGGVELGEDPWVLEDLRTTRAGDGWSVVVATPGPGEIAWHTHPGLRFSMAGFSDPDQRAVADTNRPLGVLGYTFAAPDTLSWLAVVAGWQGIAVTAAIQAVLRAEARGWMGPTVSKIGVAARILFPDGTLLPVRRLRAAAWRRALETGAFEVDRAASAAATRVNRALGAAWERIKKALSEGTPPRPPHELARAERRG